jgi:hypothetical protein
LLPRRRTANRKSQVSSTSCGLNPDAAEEDRLEALYRLGASASTRDGESYSINISLWAVLLRGVFPADISQRKEARVDVGHAHGHSCRKKSEVTGYVARDWIEYVTWDHRVTGSSHAGCKYRMVNDLQS